jgi:hypothetical protein
MRSMNPAGVWLVMMTTLAFRIARGVVGADRYSAVVIGEAEWASPITAVLR